MNQKVKRSVAKKAYSLVRRAITSGDLVRPESCEKCLGTPSKAVDGRSKIQAHHHDYSKPLNVQWLCAKCHRVETPLPETMGAPNYGSKNGFSKLTEAQVLEMRKLRNDGLIYKEIGGRFGVGKHAAMRACTGAYWAHLKDQP